MASTSKARRLFCTRGWSKVAFAAAATTSCAVGGGFMAGEIQNAVSPGPKHAAKMAPDRHRSVASPPLRSARRCAGFGCNGSAAGVTCLRCGASANIRTWVESSPGSGRVFVITMRRTPPARQQIDHVTERIAIVKLVGTLREQPALELLIFVVERC